MLEVIDHDDLVVAEIRTVGRGAISNVAVEQTMWQAIRLRDGQAVSWRGFATRVEALEAVGLGE